MAVNVQKVVVGVVGVVALLHCVALLRVWTVTEVRPPTDHPAERAGVGAEPAPRTNGRDSPAPPHGLEYQPLPPGPPAPADGVRGGPGDGYLMAAAPAPTDPPSFAGPENPAAGAAPPGGSSRDAVNDRHAAPPGAPQWPRRPPPLPHRSNAMLLEDVCVDGRALFVPDAFEQHIRKSPTSRLHDVLRPLAEDVGVGFEGWKHGIHWRSLADSERPITVHVRPPSMVQRAHRAEEGAMMVHYHLTNLYHVFESFWALYLTSTWRAAVLGAPHGDGPPSAMDVMPFASVAEGDGRSLYEDFADLFPVSPTVFAEEAASRDLRRRTRRSSRPVCFDRLWILGQQDLCSGKEYRGELRRFADLVATRLGLAHPPLVQLIRRRQATLVRRKHTRMILNEEAVVQLLERDGYWVRVVEMETLALPQQAALVAEHTDLFVAMHGQAIAHIPFLHRAAAVVQLCPFASASCRFYTCLARGLRLRMYNVDLEFREAVLNPHAKRYKRLRRVRTEHEFRLEARRWINTRWGNHSLFMYPYDFNVDLDKVARAVRRLESSAPLAFNRLHQHERRAEARLRARGLEPPSALDALLHREGGEGAGSSDPRPAPDRAPGSEEELQREEWVASVRRRRGRARAAGHPGGGAGPPPASPGLEGSGLGVSSDGASGEPPLPEPVGAVAETVGKERAFSLTRALAHREGNGAHAGRRSSTVRSEAERRRAREQLAVEGEEGESGGVSMRVQKGERQRVLSLWRRMMRKRLRETGTLDGDRDPWEEDRRAVEANLIEPDGHYGEEDEVAENEMPRTVEEELERTAASAEDREKEEEEEKEEEAEAEGAEIEDGFKGDEAEETEEKEEGEEEEEESDDLFEEDRGPAKKKGAVRDRGEEEEEEEAAAAEDGSYGDEAKEGEEEGEEAQYSEDDFEDDELPREVADGMVLGDEEVGREEDEDEDEDGGRSAGGREGAYAANAVQEEGTVSGSEEAGGGDSFSGGARGGGSGDGFEALNAQVIRGGFESTWTARTSKRAPSWLEHDEKWKRVVMRNPHFHGGHDAPGFDAAEAEEEGSHPQALRVGAAGQGASAVQHGGALQRAAGSPHPGAGEDDEDEDFEDGGSIRHSSSPLSPQPFEIEPVRFPDTEAQRVLLDGTLPDSLPPPADGETALPPGAVLLPSEAAERAMKRERRRNTEQSQAAGAGDDMQTSSSSSSQQDGPEVPTQLLPASVALPRHAVGYSVRPSQRGTVAITFDEKGEDLLIPPTLPRMLKRMSRDARARSRRHPRLSGPAEDGRDLRIYVYDLPLRFNVDQLLEVRRSPRRWQAYLRSLPEAKLHRNLLHSQQLTKDPEEADLFFVPVYSAAVLAGRATSSEHRAEARRLVLDALEYIRRTHPFWDRYDGADHLWVFSHEHGACLDIVAERAVLEPGARELMHELRHSIWVSPNGEVGSGCFRPRRDVVVPPGVSPGAEKAARYYLLSGRRKLRGLPLVPKRGGGANETSPELEALHTLTEEEMEQSARLLARGFSGRPTLTSFRGRVSLESPADAWQAISALYGPLREQRQRPRMRPSARPCWMHAGVEIGEQCAGTCEAELARSRVFSRGVRQSMERLYQHVPQVAWNALQGRMNPLLEMRRSAFCLTPLGYSTWNVRTFEALMLGCVPVILADDTVLPFEDAIDWPAVSKRFREVSYATVHLALQRVLEEELQESQRRILRVLPRLLYTNGAPQPGDAYHGLLAELAKRKHNLLPKRDRPYFYQQVMYKPQPRYQAKLSRSSFNVDAAPREGTSPVICAATQMTPDRLGLLERLAEHWGGVVSAAILVEDDAEEEELRAALRPLRSVHATIARSGGAQHYPINVLRNLAVKGCDTEYVLIIDADFVPSKETYAELQRAAAHYVRGSRIAHVVPALEVSESLRQSHFVLNMTKEQVARLGQGDKQHFTLRRSLVRPFQVGIYMHGHFHTQFGRWFRTSKPYEIEYGYGFEPYVMMRKPFPEFDESFIGYGQNKISFAYELAAARYRFVVLPRAFILHLHEDDTIGHMNPTRSTFHRIKKKKDFTVGWSCWAEFLDRVEWQYNFRMRDPCWVSAHMWHIVHKKRRDRCVRNEYEDVSLVPTEKIDVRQLG